MEVEHEARLEMPPRRPSTMPLLLRIQRECPDECITPILCVHWKALRSSDSFSSGQIRLLERKRQRRMPPKCPFFTAPLQLQTTTEATTNDFLHVPRSMNDRIMWCNHEKNVYR